MLPINIYIFLPNRVGYKKGVTFNDNVTPFMLYRSEWGRGVVKRREIHSSILYVILEKVSSSPVYY